MKVFEYTPQRLDFGFGVWFLNRIQCVLDKPANTFTFRRRVCGFQAKDKVYTLSDITEVSLFKVEGSAGEAGKFETTYPIVFFSSGGDVRLASGTGTDLKKTVELMKQFIGGKSKVLPN